MNDFTVFFLVILPLIFLFFNLSGFIIIALHELGHAIPAIIFTKKPAEIFIGGYGEGKYWQLKVDKLTINIKSQFVYITSGGVCQHSKIEKGYQQVIVLIGGTVFTVIVAATAMYLVFNYDMHGSLKILILIIFVSTIISLFNNLYPKEKIIKLSENKITYNDGYQLFKLLKRGRYISVIDKASVVFGYGNYVETLQLLEQFEHPSGDIEIFRMMLHCYSVTGDFEMAKSYKDKYFNSLSIVLLNSDDYVNVGVAESRVDNNDEAMRLYDRSLLFDANNIFGLNNRGYTYVLQGEYEKALIDLSKAIELNDEFAYSFSNRGLAYLRLGNIEAGLADIEYSLKLDPENSYGYKNLGIYYLEKKDYEQALQFFEKAKSLDSLTHNIDKYISNANLGLNDL